MFLKTHYFWRTYLGYVAVALIGTFLFAASLVGRTGLEVRENLDTTLRNTAELLALAVQPAMKNLDYEKIRGTVASVSESTGLRMTVIDANGVVLADSHENPLNMNNHLHRPEVQMAFLNGTGQAQRYSYTLHEDFRYMARPVYAGDQLLGFARVAKSGRSLDEQIEEEEVLLVRNAAVVAFFILLLGFYLAARQAVKVAEITNVAKEISQGNFERRIPEGNNMGLKKIAEAINQMARSSAKSVTDITADRNRLATIFTCMVEGVIDVDLDQKILHINEAATRLLSVSEKSCIGKPLWEEIRNQEIINALDEAIRTHSVIKTQMKLQRESGQGVVDIYAASLSDDGGEPIGAVLVLHDITELKNLERVRTDFVANASHELKTPITAIRGLAETILGDEDVDRPTLVNFIDRVHAQSLRLSQLVGDLMTISRLESGHNGENFSTLNLADVVKHSVKTAKSAAGEKHQELLTDLPEEKIEVWGDRQNLSQLVDNLIDNAIKYTPDAGTITVTLKQDDNDAVLSVQDTGIGISPQFQQRVFERFYRVDKARSQSLGGTGLGLSIVKNIAEKHGGGVRVESQLGSGSIFILRLPLKKTDEKA